MKFGKSLSNQIEEALPEWRDKFISYKDLKKRLKLIRATSCGADRSAKRRRVADRDDAAPAPTEAEVNAAAAAVEGAVEPAPVMTREEEEDFMGLLEVELEKFNAFFLEKEEEYIIRQKELQDRVTAAFSEDSNEELMKVGKEIVDFHGEMVLLENYSALNYTGLVKILKKYDKRTGALIRLPFIQRVLQQPFFTTDVLFKLVKECESMLDRLFPKNEQSSSAQGSGQENREDKPLMSGSSFVSGTVPELEEIEHMESEYAKSTRAALRSLKEIRSGSSTVSVFSLPPLQPNNGFDEKCNTIPVVEQAAK